MTPYEIKIDRKFEEYELRSGGVYLGIMDFRVTTYARWYDDDGPHFSETRIYAGAKLDQYIGPMNHPSTLSEMVGQAICDDPKVWGDLISIANEQALKDGAIKWEAA